MSNGSWRSRQFYVKPNKPKSNVSSITVNCNTTYYSRVEEVT